MIQVTLVASQDRQLEDMLRVLGMQVTRAGSDVSASKPADIVILDVRGGTSLPSAVAAIKRHNPDAGLVIVSPSLDPSLLLEAMRAGVNEVLPEPVTMDELRRVVEHVTGRRSHAEPGRVYGFVGAKGGVGTTTVAVNVAAALGAVSKPDRALLVDLHRSGGDAAIFTAADPRFSLSDALENTHRLDETYLKSVVVQTSPHTDLLASPERPARGFDADRATRIVAFASSVYKHTVVDLPRSDATLLEGFEQVTAIYIVANQELATVKSAGRLASTLRDHYGREKVMLVLSRSDRQAEIAPEDVEKAVGLSVAHTFPSDYRVALQALNKGRPVSLDNHNDLSASFRRFALNLAGVRPQREARPQGLFGRLAHLRS